MPGDRTEAARYSPLQNHLLAALPAEEFERIRPHLELAKLTAGEVLYESGGELRYFYFPISGVVSLLHVMEDGSTGEIAILGNDGFVGVSVLLGGDTNLNRKIVQIPGAPTEFRAPSCWPNSTAAAGFTTFCCAMSRGF